MIEVMHFEITDLPPLIVSNIWPTGRKLVKGAYGSTEEVEIPGAVCAAKKIHTDYFNICSSEDL